MNMRGIESQSFAGIPVEWLPFAAFWMFLFVLAGAELFLPIHRRPAETKGRLIANFGLGVVDAALVALLPLSAMLVALWAQERGFGLFNAMALPAIPAVLASVAVLSLAGYVLHRLEHRVPMLWRFHRVHHCDTAIDISTSFRSHPGARFILAAWMAAITLLLGLSVAAIAFYNLVGAAFGLLTHVNLRLPQGADRLLRLLFVTPQMHHVHHSSHQPETDSNYGDVFSFWDRLFGTYRHLDMDALTAVRFGLGDAYDKDAGSLVGQLRLPLLTPAPATDNRNVRPALHDEGNGGVSLVTKSL